MASSTSSSRFYRIQRKLIHIKDDLKLWARTHYRHNAHKVIENETKLKELQTILW